MGTNKRLGLSAASRKKVTKSKAAGRAKANGTNTLNKMEQKTVIAVLKQLLQESTPDIKTLAEDLTPAQVTKKKDEVTVGAAEQRWYRLRKKLGLPIESKKPVAAAKADVANKASKGKGKATSASKGKAAKRAGEGELGS